MTDTVGLGSRYGTVLLRQLRCAVGCRRVRRFYDRGTAVPQLVGQAVFKYWKCTPHRSQARFVSHVLVHVEVRDIPPEVDIGAPENVEMNQISENASSRRSTRLGRMTNFSRRSNLQVMFGHQFFIPSSMTPKLINPRVPCIFQGVTHTQACM